VSEEFKSDNVSVKVERQKGCILKLEVKASPSLVKEAEKKALKEIGKEITLPGFRKGKAPVEMVRKNYLPAIEQKWQKKIADLSFVEAEKLIKIYPLNSSTTINFDLKSHSLEEGALLTFSFETEPEVPAVDPASFVLKEIPEPTLEENKIDEAIHQAQFFYASWKEVERPVKEGDFVIIDLEAIDSDPPIKVFSNTRFEIKDRSIAHWMKNLLIGAKKNEILEGVSSPDEELASEEKKKFEPKKVRIKILKIEEALLPEINNDFAKKMGASSVEEMHQNISKMLLTQLQNNVDREKKEEVNKFLIEKYTFDLPTSLIKSETKYRKDQMLADPRFKKSWDNMSAEEKATAEEHTEKQAKDALSLFYLSRKIVNDAKITITQKEIHEEVMKNVQESTPIGKTPNFKHISQELYALSLSRLIMAKAQDYILSQTKGK
jgi:trigger factor